MKKEIKEKWIKELRSGKHRQTIGSLKVRNGAMCCLGVLETKVLGEKYQWCLNSYHNKSGDEGELGYENMVQCEIGTDEMLDLIDLNDEKGYSFEQIADYVEENL